MDDVCNKKYFASLKNVRTFAPAFERKSRSEQDRYNGPVVQFG
jgi:hypothetical protein